MDRTFKSILWLDDMRQPLVPGIAWVKNYAEFVAYLQENGTPELISFDHDLSLEHYPTFEQDVPGHTISYADYREKTGLECARYIVENRLPLQFWAVHSLNPEGGENIRNELRAYAPLGEVRGLKIRFRVVEAEVYGGEIKDGYSLG